MRRKNIDRAKSLSRDCTIYRGTKKPLHLEGTKQTMRSSGNVIHGKDNFFKRFDAGSTSTRKHTQTHT